MKSGTQGEKKAAEPLFERTPRTRLWVTTCLLLLAIVLLWKTSSMLLLVLAAVWVERNLISLSPQ